MDLRVTTNSVQLSYMDLSVTTNSAQ